MHRLLLAVPACVLISFGPAIGQNDKLTTITGRITAKGKPVDRALVVLTDKKRSDEKRVLPPLVSRVVDGRFADEYVVVRPRQPLVIEWPKNEPHVFH